MFTVYDYAGGRYWPVKAFGTLAEAIDYARTLGYKTKVTSPEGKKVKWS